MIPNFPLVRLGFIADTHNEQNGRLQTAVSLMGKVDYLFHLGDFINNYNPRIRQDQNPYRAYQNTARKITEIRKEFKIPGIFVIPGNHDVRHPENGLCELEEFSLHQRILAYIRRLKIMGYGGGFNFVQSGGWERYTNARYRNQPEVLEAMLSQHNPEILLLHQLESKSESLRQVIQRNPPKIVLSGHTHEHSIEEQNGIYYASCGPIFPLDPRNHRLAGKSSYGVLELGEKKARIRLYFFGRKGKGYKTDLDKEVTFEI